ncbi:MAG: peptidase S14, partial [Burkholderiales bacterium 66-5]
MTHTITVFGLIGGAVSADTIRAQLASLTPGTTLSVEINSEGGSVQEAIAIFNTLSTWSAPVEVTITGWALSAATIVAMAGSRIRMHATSLMMVHAPWLSAASGNAQELRQHADALDQVAQTMRAAYRRTQQSADVINRWLDGGDHWFTADQALDAGLIDEVIEAPAYAIGTPVLAACRFLVPPEILERINTMNAPITSEEIRAAALAEDRARRQEIRTRFQAFAQRPGMPALLQTLEDDPAMTADQATNKVMAHLGKDTAPVYPLGAFTRVETTDNRAGELRAAARDMLMIRAGLKVNDPHPAVRDIQRLNIVALAERFVSMAGKSCAGMGKGDVVRAALTTGDFPLLLTSLTARSLRTGYLAAPATHTLWTGERSVPDFRTQTLAQLSEAPSLEEVREAAEYTYGSFAEAAETFAVKTFGKIVRFTRQALINDDLGALTTIPAAQGAAARRLEADLVYTK